jgi:hypothetical protein
MSFDRNLKGEFEKVDLVRGAHGGVIDAHIPSPAPF